MTPSKRQATPRGGYAIGYGKPPVHTRVAKAQPGNPGGRPHGGHGTPVERAKAPALEKATAPSS